MASKLCDSCKSATTTPLYSAGSAFLCLPYDAKIHATNKLSSLCEQAPVHVTCKVVAAVLCLSGDHNIHFANPLASRHEHIPLYPFHHQHQTNRSSLTPNPMLTSQLKRPKFPAPSSNRKGPNLNSSYYSFPEIYLNFVKTNLPEHNNGGTADGVMSVQSQSKTATEHYSDNNIDSPPLSLLPVVTITL